MIANRTNLPNNTLDKVKIVAAENFYGNIASQIGGDNVEVLSILSNPSQDPHDYDATSKDARDISNADIVIESGAGYDPFMGNILSTTSNKIVINVANLSGITEEDNPHVWYSTDIIKTFATNLLDKLVEMDSLNQGRYKDGYNSFINSLNSIESECLSIKNLYNGTKVVAMERVADYMLLKCGLIPIKNDFQKAVEEENDPSVTAINSFENILKTHEAKVLIYNNQTESQLTLKEKTFAEENNVPVVGVTETMPIGATYQSWMQSQLNDLKNALNSNK